MISRKIVLGVVVVLALVLGAGSLVLAQGGPRPGERGPGGQMVPPPVLGEILSIEGNTWVIKPQLPKIMERRERPEQRFRELPEEVSFTVTADTKYFLDGGESDASSFGVGDLVVAVVKGKPDALAATHIADPETAREYLRDKIGQFRDQRGEMGMQRRGRPAFGTIMAIDGNSITMKPEIPQFVKDAMDKRGQELPDIELPDEVTLTLGERTRFLVDGERVESNPFAVGDKVAVMGGRGDMPAMAVADYATAEQMAKLGGPPEGQGPGGPGQGGGPRGPRGPR